MKDRAIEELFIEEYYGFDPDVLMGHPINTDYSDVVNLLAMFKEKILQDGTWIKASKKLPEFNVGVFVFIPEEDEHITTGMWDISEKWVLLDDYRVPTSQVTYWMPMINKPIDRSYNPVHKDSDTDDDSLTKTIRRLQRRIYELEHS